MLKKVKLYGELADKYGKDWNLDVTSPAEAIRALCANNAGFKRFLLNSEKRGVGYKVVTGDRYIDSNAEILEPFGKGDIKIIPVVLGAKSKIGKIIVGAIMIYLAYQYGVDSTGALTTMGSIVANVGMSLIMSGVAEMLAPDTKGPTSDALQKDKTGHAFDGPANTINQGVAIPVCYGQLIIGGATISSGIMTEDTDGT